MSTTTATFGHDTIAAPSKAPRKGFFARLIEARMRQGQARVSSVFERMSDAYLADLGFTPDQIRNVRGKGKIPADYWA